MENQEKDMVKEAETNEEESSREEVVEVAEETDSKKKTQNMISIGILLLGLFVGSLFVDVVQLITGSGFSQQAIRKATVLESGDKTWVAYEDPIVHVDVLTEKDCAQCAPDQALVWLRRVMPTLSAREVEYQSAEGKILAEKSGALSLPAFIFGSEVSKTDVFAQAEALFVKKDDGKYVLSTEQLGIPSGKLLAFPEIKEGDIQTGPKDAKVKIVEYSDFQCPYCQLIQPTIRQILNEYKDTVLFSYKHFPLNFHQMANSAALASECANEQGKFFEYHDMLFAKQKEWGAATTALQEASAKQGKNPSDAEMDKARAADARTLKAYAASLGMQSAQFNQCLDSAKYQEKVDADTEEGKKFGVSGTPGTFVNDKFIGGAVSVDELKQAIDEQLAK